MALAIALGTTAWRRQPPDESALNGDALPAVIEVQQGGTFNLASYVSGGTPPYEFDIDGAGDPLPEGVTLDPETGVLSADAEAETNTGSEPDVQFGVTDSAPAGALDTEIVLHPGQSGANAYVVGLAFAEGEVPDGSYVATDAAAGQVTLMGQWPDGSARRGIVAVRDSFTASTPKVVALTSTQTPPAGSSVTEAALVSKNPSVVLEVSGIGTVELGDLIGEVCTGKGTPGLVRTRLAGPVMSEFHYYSQVGSDAHLSAWFFCQIFATGELRVRTVLENGWLGVASPGSRTYDVTLTINGVERYSGEALVHRHHQRWTRLDYYDTDPEIVPEHDGDHQMLTGMFPHHGWRSPTSGAWSPYSSAVENPTPFAQGNWRSAMSDSGWHSSLNVVNEWESLYLTSGDARAWKAMIGNASTHGRYPIHYRDEGDLKPVRMSRSAYATLVVNGTHDGISRNGNSSTNNYTPTPTDGGFLASEEYEHNHCPSAGYAAAILSGDYCFVEEAEFASGVISLLAPDTARQGVKCIGVSEVRGKGWSNRCYWQAFLVSEDADMVADAGAKLAANYEYFADRVAAGEWANSLGAHDLYSANGTTSAAYFTGQGVWGDAPWMIDFCTEVFGQARSAKAWPNETARDDLIALTNHLFKHVVGRLGDAAGYNYRQAAPYGMAYGEPEIMPPTSWYANWGEAYEANLELQEGASVSADEGESLLTGMTNSAAADMAQSHRWGPVVYAAALAYEHGAAGAVDAWRRLTTASNFASLAAGFHNNPGMGVRPRNEA